MELSQLQKAIEKHAAQRKLLNDATSMGHNYGNSFVKLIPEEAHATRDLVIGLLASLRQADQDVHKAWSAKKKILEQLHIFLMFQNSCRYNIFIGASKVARKVLRPWNFRTQDDHSYFARIQTSYDLSNCDYSGISRK